MHYTTATGWKTNYCFPQILSSCMSDKPMVLCIDFWFYWSPPPDSPVTPIDLLNHHLSIPKPIDDNGLHFSILWMTSTNTKLRIFEILSLYPLEYGILKIINFLFPIRLYMPPTHVFVFVFNIHTIISGMWCGGVAWECDWMGNRCMGALGILKIDINLHLWRLPVKIGFSRYENFIFELILYNKCFHPVRLRSLWSHSLDSHSPLSVYFVCITQLNTFLPSSHFHLVAMRERWNWDWAFPFHFIHIFRIFPFSVTHQPHTPTFLSYLFSKHSGMVLGINLTWGCLSITICNFSLLGNGRKWCGG